MKKLEYDNKEFKKLEKDNVRIRDTLRDIIEEWGGDQEEIWSLINKLVNNELEQEQYCN